MKTTGTLIKRKLEKMVLLGIMLFSTILAFAQDAGKTADVDITTTKTTTTTTEEWYTNPLYWIIGAILLIILVAVAARGGSRRD